MNQQTRTGKERGFSLVEMLVVIAVIGIIAAIAVPSIGAISGQANTAKAKRNAQTIASLYNASRGVGAAYASTDTSNIIDELVVGKSGPELAGTEFKISSMSDEEKTAAMAYVSYDAAADLMSYSAQGVPVEEVAPVAADWTYWSSRGHAGHASFDAHYYATTPFPDTPIPGYMSTDFEFRAIGVDIEYRLKQ